MAERSNAHDSKSCDAGMYPRVQIPFSAPSLLDENTVLLNTVRKLPFSDCIILYIVVLVDFKCFWFWLLSFSLIWIKTGLELTIIFFITTQATIKQSKENKLEAVLDFHHSLWRSKAVSSQIFERFNAWIPMGTYNCWRISLRGKYLRYTSHN